MNFADFPKAIWNKRDVSNLFSCATPPFLCKVFFYRPLRVGVHHAPPTSLPEKEKAIRSLFWSTRHTRRIFRVTTTPQRILKAILHPKTYLILNIAILLWEVVPRNKPRRNRWTNMSSRRRQERPDKPASKAVPPQRTPIIMIPCILESFGFGRKKILSPNMNQWEC